MPVILFPISKRYIYISIKFSNIAVNCHLNGMHEIVTVSIRFTNNLVNSFLATDKSNCIMLNVNISYK